MGRNHISRRKKRKDRKRSLEAARALMGCLSDVDLLRLGGRVQSGARRTTDGCWWPLFQRENVELAWELFEGAGFTLTFDDRGPDKFGQFGGEDALGNLVVFIPDTGRTVVRLVLRSKNPGYVSTRRESCQPSRST